MQLDALQREVVVGFDGDADFFNGVYASVGAGMRDLHGRRAVDAGFDEIVLAQANAFALFLGGEVKHAVLLDGDAWR